MRGILLVVVLLIGILLGATGCYVYFLWRGNQKSHFNHTLGREKAYGYLVSSYNSTLGLCHEHPGSNWYWISHDNALVSYVLQNWNRTIADNITATIRRIAGEYDLAVNSEGIPLDTRAEVLLGYTIDFISELSNEPHLNYSYFGSVLLSEKATGVPSIFVGYADLLCYASLSEWRKQNYSGADFCYQKVEAMWDGKGFRDSAYENNKYETYKLGLFYLLSRTLNKDFGFKKELVERVWLCQSSDGGFWTHYYGNGTTPSGVYTNTETTSIILLADVPSFFEYY
jgi:hypothetical protein